MVMTLGGEGGVGAHAGRRSGVAGSCGPPRRCCSRRRPRRPPRSRPTPSCAACVATTCRQRRRRPLTTYGCGCCAPTGRGLRRPRRCRRSPLQAPPRPQRPSRRAPAAPARRTTESAGTGGCSRGPGKHRAGRAAMGKGGEGGGGVVTGDKAVSSCLSTFKNETSRGSGGMTRQSRNRCRRALPRHEGHPPALHRAHLENASHVAGVAKIEEARRKAILFPPLPLPSSPPTLAARRHGGGPALFQSARAAESPGDPRRTGK